MNVESKKNVEIELRLLAKIQENKNISQRSISKELNVALGFANSLVKKFVKKGFLKLKHAPMQRFFYYVTPRGLIEKSRLTKEYFQSSLNFYKKARLDFEQIFKFLKTKKAQNVYLIGTGEICEIAILTSNLENVKIGKIYDENFDKKQFYGISVENSFGSIVFRKKSFYILCESFDPNGSYKKLSFLKDNILTPEFMMINRK